MLTLTFSIFVLFLILSVALTARWNSISLGNGYCFCEKIDVSFSYTKWQDDILIKGLQINGDDGYIYNHWSSFRTPIEVSINCIEYCDDKYVIAKGMNKNTDEEIYWIFLHRQFKKYGPLSKEEFIDKCTKYSLSPIYVELVEKN